MSKNMLSSTEDYFYHWYLMYEKKYVEMLKLNIFNSIFVYINMNKDIRRKLHNRINMKKKNEVQSQQ